MNTRRSILVLLPILLVLAACTTPRAPTPTRSGEVFVGLEASYALVSTQEMIEQADAILAGEVLSISPTRWNQDSGEYWDSGSGQTGAFPIYRLEITISEPLVDRIGLGATAAITVLGTSPLDTNSTIATSHDAIACRPGDGIVIFAGRTEIGWRDGRRPALLFMGVPNDSYLLLGDDGLYHHQRTNVADKEPVSLDALRERIAAAVTSTPPP